MDDTLRRAAVGLALLGIGAGCSATPGARGAAAPAQREGTYRFSERVPDTSPSVIILEGSMKVTRDSVAFDMVPGPCRYAQPSEQVRTAFIYQCGDVRVAIDRVDPSRVSYSLKTVVLVTRRECVEYSPTDKRLCIRWQERKDEQLQLRSGRIRLSRAS